MKTNLKAVYRHLDTNLSKQEKIELGLIQDGQQSAEQLLDISRELVGLAGSINRIKVSVKSLAQDGAEQEKYLQRVTAQITSINKELGIKTKVPELSKMEDAIDKFQASFNLIDSIAKIKV